MIPATQRPDGTWRKARKIRTGFSSRSGGATRYVPPAFRHGVGGDGGGGSGGDETGDGGLGSGHARSLGEIDAAGGERGAWRFLSAALFLLTATSAPSTTAHAEGGQEQDEEGASPSSNSGRSSPSGVDRPVEAPGLPLRSAVRAAQKKLRCDHCRQISPENAAAAAAGDGASTPEKSESGRGRTGDSAETSSNSRSGRQRREEGTSRDNDNGSDGWWARLRLAERSWLVSETTQQQDGTSTPTAKQDPKAESWIGLELRLRPSDVCYADGQSAIIDFLKERAGRQAGRQDNQGARSPVEAQPPESVGTQQPSTSPAPADSQAAAAAAAAAAGEGAEKKGEVPSDARSPERGRRKAPESGRVDGGAAAGAGVPLGREDHLRQIGDGATVLVAVLVFGGELSKRDRAGLHGQAEKDGGVASSSHGVGEGRFLTLSCGLRGGAGAVEIELSPEKAELARCLFRLAQQEYHSRYECLSHREIREVVALGGPTAQTHPDLFRLLEKKQQQQQQQDSSNLLPNNLKKKKKKAAGNRVQSGATEAFSPAEEGPSGQRDTVTGFHQHRSQQEHHQRDGDIGAGTVAGTVVDAEPMASPLETAARVTGAEGGSSPAGREKREGRASALQGREEAAEPALPVERCPW